MTRPRIPRLSDQLSLLSLEELEQLRNVLTETRILISWIDIIRFARDVFKVEPSPKQREFLEDFSQYNRKTKRFVFKKHLLSGSRGGGKTLIASIAALWAVSIFPFITGEEYRVILMGGSERQARKSYSYITKAIENNPLLESLVVGRPYKEKTIFSRGELIVLPASEKAARHDHVDMLLIDEAALVPENVMKAALPIIQESRNPKLVLTSTPGATPTSTFNDMLLNPESWGIDKVYILSVHEATWKDKEEVEILKQKYDPDEFKREFEGQLVFNTKNAFDYKKWAKYGVEKPIFYPTSPSYGAIDWGFSKKAPTAIVVAQVRNKIFYIMTAHYIRGSNEEYVYQRIMAEFNRYNVKEVFTDASHPGPNNRLMQEGFKVMPIQAKGKKAHMIMRLKNHLESGLIRYPIHLKEMLYEFSTYHWEIDEKGSLIPLSKKDHIVDALAILLEGYYRRPGRKKIALFLGYD